MALAIQSQQINQTCLLLQEASEGLASLVRKLHLLASNTLAAAARNNPQAEILRVLTQEIQQLQQDIARSVQQAQPQLGKIVAQLQADMFHNTELNTAINEVLLALSPLPSLVKKGDYLSKSAAVEAVHGEDKFDTIAVALDALASTLRQQEQQLSSILLQLQDWNR